MSFEALVLQTVCHFFREGVWLNKGTFLGGTACKDQLDSACNDKRTKGAYPDIPLISTDCVAVVEVDENQHQYYNQTCELARYGTLQFGTAVLLPTRVGNYLNEELDIGTAPVASVEWLFCGQGSNQRMFAEHASATLHILTDNIALDADIATFSLSDLGSLEAVVNAAVVEKISEIGGHERQCHAINHANNHLKRKRCSAASMKNSNICSQHYKSQLAGKMVVYHNNDVDSVARTVMQLLPPEMAMAVVSHMHPHEAMKMQRLSHRFKFVSLDTLFAVAHLQQSASKGLDEDSVEFSCLNCNYVSQLIFF
ncbi:hypothetical protein HDU77_004681 [Chytriomyces hyalinus]|nr:hypothetical protein HDU77_004681 [Chytriomyces hyalinus]